MVIGVVSRRIIIAVGMNDEYRLIAVKLAEVSAALIIVEALHIGIEPNLSPAKGGNAVGLKHNALHIELRQHIAPTLAPLDEYFGEVAV